MERKNHMNNIRLQDNFTTVERFEESSSSSTDESTDKTTKNNTQVVDFVSQIFSNSGLMFLGLIVVIYLVVFVFFGMYLRRNEETGPDETIRRTFDFAIFGFLFVYGLYKYVRLDEATKDNLLKAGTQKLIEFYDDPLTLFSTMLFVTGFYLIVFLLRVPMGRKPFSVLLVEAVGLFFLATLVIHNCLKYFFEVDLLQELRDPKWQEYIDPTATESDVAVDGSGNVITETKPKDPEVFNLSNNLYTYDDAQAICRAYDSRLATYDEIEAAYENGAEWCNYGWSADQMAFFPTQKGTWQELQQSEKHKNSCGRPGVNGGYFANPNIKFGVNCFGVKPDPKENDLSLMETRKDRPYPRTEEEKKMDELVEYWKENSQDTLRVSGFNRDKWSRY